MVHTCTLQFRESKKTKRTTQKTEVDTQMTRSIKCTYNLCYTYVILIFYLSYTCLIHILYLSYTDLLLILLSYYVGNEYLYWAKQAILTMWTKHFRAHRATMSRAVARVTSVSCPETVTGPVRHSIVMTTPSLRHWRRCHSALN